MTGPAYHGRTHSPNGTDPIPGIGGYQFNAGTYAADNVGDWSLIEYTGTIGSAFSEATALYNDPSTFGLGVTSANGLLFTADPDNAYSVGHPVLQIDQYVTSGGTGGYGLGINVGDTTAATDGGVTGIGVSVEGAGISTPTGINVTAIGTADVTDTVYGYRATTQNLGSGSCLGGFVTATSVDGASTGLRAYVPGSAGGSAIGVQGEAASTTELAIGVDAIASPNSTDGGYGVRSNVSITSGTGAGESIGIYGSGTLGSEPTGNAVGVHAIGTHNGSTGKEIGLRARTAGLRTGANSVCIQALDAGGNRIFEVWEDGTIHGLTGGAITWDL